MTDLLPSPELCWADATIIANFEAATLPLLYAPEEDCKQYFQAMKRKNPRKGLGLEAVYALCLQARAAKDSGSYLEALRFLRDGADRRLQLFHGGDYQVVAAYEHCVWCAIHLGVLELSSTKSSGACAASSLFSFGLDVLRSCRGAVNGSILSPFVTITLEFVLHYNWTSYFMHRSKWHAAAHHAQITLQRWRKLTLVDGNPAVEPFGKLLTVRRLIAEEKVGENLLRTRKELVGLHVNKTVSQGSSEVGEDAAAYGSTTSTAVPGEERDVISMDHQGDSLEEHDAPTNAPTMLTLTVTSSGEERELTVCLSATRPQNAWEGSIESLVNFLAVYCGCSCDVSMKDYTKTLDTLVPVPVGNPLWEKAVEGLRGIANAKRNAAVAMADNIHPMPSSMTRSDGLQIQRIMKKYMLSEKSRKQRQRLEQARRQHLMEEGADEDLPPEELEAKWRIAPSQHELSGLLVEESKHSASIAAFTSMFPLLQRRVAAKDALRVLEETSMEIVSPAEAARCATEVRLTTRPHTTAAHYKDGPLSDVHGASTRPASVEPTKGGPSMMNPPALRPTMSRPPTQSGVVEVKKFVLPDEVLDVYGRTQPTQQQQQRTRSPSPIHKHDLNVSSHSHRSPSVAANSMSVADRNTLLMRTAVDWSIGETEASIASKPTTYRATAVALRAFAASLTALADDYDRDAEKLDESEVRFQAAMSVHATQAAEDAEKKSRGVAGDAHPTDEMVVSFSEVRGSTRSPTNRSPVLPPAPLTQWGAAGSQPRALSPIQPLMATINTSSGDLDAVRQKQRQLRALLPSIDHHSTAYRMVVKELADNERLLQQQREAETIAKLAKDAQIGAERRKSMAHRSPGRTPPLDPAPRPALGMLSGTTSPRVSPDALMVCSCMLAIMLGSSEAVAGDDGVAKSLSVHEEGDPSDSSQPA